MGIKMVENYEWHPLLFSRALLAAGADQGEGSRGPHPPSP